MKKLVLTIAIVLGMGLTSFAQDNAFNEGGLFGRGETPQYNYFADWADLGWIRDGSLLSLPNQHGLTGDYQAPLGTGIAVLLGLGGAYLVAKKRKENK